jgi:SAM-dependent methyltransferase
MIRKCKFCNKKFNSISVVYDYYKNKSTGYFGKCNFCNIDIQSKFINKLYLNQNSSNYNLNKNIFYHLKQMFLLKHIFSLRNFFNQKKDILDYGCGSGEFAAALSNFYKDKNIYTSDVFKLDKKFIPNVKKHYLINKGQLKNKKFDLILMRHVLEHIFDLNRFIKNIKKNLKNNDSQLIIEVPNRHSIWRKIMNRRWPGYFYPFHYYVFSNKFLNSFLNANGLKVIKQQNLEPPIIGSYLLTYQINLSICKLLSIIFYPIQFLISKFFFSSEAILIIVKKN